MYVGPLFTEDFLEENVWNKDMDITMRW